MRHTPSLLLLVLAFAGSAWAEEPRDATAAALARAGANAPQIRRALADVPAAERRGMHFLVEHMPAADLRTLTADFLLENVRLAYRAWNEAPWKAAVPEAVFLNGVLPYASVNEAREAWRTDFYARFKPLVAAAKTPAAAGALLNQKVFPLLKVKYSRKRRRPDQAPSESIATGTASCTGLSILLIDACRAVGVPARFVGTPLWSDGSGNHSWVEIWDAGWHFTGAAEPTGDALDRGWFAGRASTAKRDEVRHAIFATSWKRTPQPFPLVWAPGDDSVFAVNVTDRYTRKRAALPEGYVRVRFRLLDRPGGERRTAAVHAQAGEDVHAGTTRDERFDGNDHLTFVLQRGVTYAVRVVHGERTLARKVEVSEAQQLETFLLDDGGK